MKRPYLVGLKCRELMKKHFEAYASKKLSVCPANCRHNQAIIIGDLKTEVRICTAAQRPGMTVETNRIILCQTITQAAECSLYDPKYVLRSDVEEAFKSEVSDPARKRQLYPDVAALEWVLDNDYHEAVRSTKFHVRIMLKLISYLEKLIKRIGGKPGLLSWEKKQQVAPTAASLEKVAVATETAVIPEIPRSTDAK